MNKQLLHWYKSKHPAYTGENCPSPLSKAKLDTLNHVILEPLEHEFGQLVISYGFTSAELSRWIQANTPKDTAPKVDQHASMELNLKGNRICKRDGAACDVLLKKPDVPMSLVAKFIIKNLPFDRLYFYGNSKPIHISIGPENTRYVQLRHTKRSGKRIAGPSRYGLDALTLFSQ